MLNGDYVTESEERRRAAIIDNLLFVATYGASKAIIEDASYALDDADAERCRLTLSSYGGEYVFMAIVNFRLAYRLKPVELTLEKGFVHYVYVVCVSGMDTDPALCRVIASTTPYSDVNHLLVAKVDYTGSVATLDVDTDKQYLTNLAAHSMDCTNPHGTSLVQDTLAVTGKLLLRGTEMMSCVLHEISSSPGSTPAVVRLEGMTPKFVTPMIDDPEIGAVACRINTDGTISVTNSGVAGKPIILKIEGVSE